MAVQERYYNVDYIEQVDPSTGATFDGPDLKGYRISWLTVIDAPDEGGKARRVILMQGEEAALNDYRSEPGVAEMPASAVRARLGQVTGRPWSNDELRRGWKLG